MAPLLSNDARYSLKMTIGSLLALLAVMVFRINGGVAVLLSVWVLMTMHRQQSLTDGLFRILGPLVGACVMYLTLNLFAPSMLIVLPIMALVAYVGFAHYIAGIFPYAGMLMAAISGIAVSLAAEGPNLGTRFAFSWVWAAVVGVAIVHVVTWLVWPDLSPGFHIEKLLYRPVFPLPPEQAWHVRRCTIVLLVTLLFIIVGRVPGGYTSVISCVIIALAPPSAGGPVRKAIHRLLGVIIGSAYGVAILVVLHHLPYMGMLLLLTGVAFFSLGWLFLRVPKYNYPLSQAGIVLALILLGDGSSIGTLSEADERLFGLIVGGVVAVLVIDLLPMPNWERPAAKSAARAITLTASTSPSSTLQAVPKRRLTPQRWALIIVALIVVFALLYVLMNHYTPHTSDAYVQAYVVQVAPLVSGRVTKVYVTDNSAVRAGDPLFELDARPFDYDLRQAEARLVITTQEVAELKRDVTIAQARVADDEQLVKSAQTLFDEINKVRAEGAASYVEYLTALDRLDDRKAAKRENEAALEKAKLVLAAILDNEHAMIRRAEAEVAMAKWRLEQSRVVAPADGHVTNVQLQPGSSINANQPVMTLIDSNRWWVIANFNENCTSRIRAGQGAEISLRSHPGRVFEARVDSVGFGVERGQGMPSGRLPAPDSAQVWVRPPQRLPVKLVIDGTSPAIQPQVGASVAVTVYTGSPNPINPLAALWQRVTTRLDYLY